MIWVVSFFFLFFSLLFFFASLSFYYPRFSLHLDPLSFHGNRLKTCFIYGFWSSARVFPSARYIHIHTRYIRSPYTVPLKYNTNTRSRIVAFYRREESASTPTPFCSTSRISVGEFRSFFCCFFFLVLSFFLSLIAGCFVCSTKKKVVKNYVDDDLAMRNHRSSLMSNFAFFSIFFDFTSCGALRE